MIRNYTYYFRDYIDPSLTAIDCCRGAFAVKTSKQIYETATLYNASRNVFY